MFYEYYPYLMHHGVKGQRWGVRRMLQKHSENRRRKKAARLIEHNRQRNINAAAIKRTKLMLSDPRKLSDETLRKVNKRLSAELDMHRTREQLSGYTTKKGKGVARKLAKYLISEIAAPAFKNAARDGLERQLSKKFGVNKATSSGGSNNKKKNEVSDNDKFDQAITNLVTRQLAKRK